MPIHAFFTFFLKNYLRSHRYIYELLAILIFHIFFWGFLYTDTPDNLVWLSFGALALILNIFTVPSLYLLENGNSLYFVLVRESGRTRYFLAKSVLITLIDFFWILIFALIYGVRFMDPNYFLVLPLQLLLIILLLFLSTLIWTMAFSSKRPMSRLFILIGFLLVIFGAIINKAAGFPLQSITDIVNILFVLLPPVQELIYLTVTLEISFWQAVFLMIALLQIVVYFIINYRRFQKCDFI